MKDKNKWINGKEILEYTRSTRRDRVGVPTLKKNGKAIMDVLGKTQALGRQYESVFTDEDMSNIPNLHAQTTATISTITITSYGIAKLLMALDSSNADA